MKRILMAGIFLLSAFTLSAQAKITKTGVVGKWSIITVEVKGVFLYDVEKDSLVLGEETKAQVPDPQQLPAIIAAIKQQLAAVAKATFLFNADGTAEMGGGTELSQKANYSVDEANSTITTTSADADKKEDILKGEMVKENLHLIASQPQGDMHMMLKRVKS
jgi:hypothetical protein